MEEKRRMNYKTHKNFLAPDLFEKIKNLIMNQDFPWRRRDHMTGNNPSDKMYFTYCFYNDMTPKSELYEPYIIPILQKLKAKAPIQVRANLSISELYKASMWHQDYNFKSKTAILYLNDCDGGTELMPPNKKIHNKIAFIKADANKMLIFDTPILHRGLTSKKEPVRYIINFNYFIENNAQ